MAKVNKGGVGEPRTVKITEAKRLVRHAMKKSVQYSFGVLQA